VSPQRHEFGRLNFDPEENFLAQLQALLVLQEAAIGEENRNIAWCSVRHTHPFNMNVAFEAVVPTLQTIVVDRRGSYAFE